MTGQVSSNSSTMPYHQQVLQGTRGERNIQLPSYKETWQPAQFKPPPAPPSLPHPLQQQRKIPIDRGREGLSRDSGVHTDNEPLHTTTTTLPHLPSHSYGQTSLKQRTITELTADRSRFNPVLRKKSTLFSLSAGEKSQEMGERKRGRRKLWEDDEEQTASVRASWMKPSHPVSPSKSPAVDKTAAAQYYLTRARYSPLTSGKHNKQNVAFGSQAPRWREKETPTKPPLLVPKLMELERHLPGVIGRPVIGQSNSGQLPQGWRGMGNREISAGAGVRGGWGPMKPKRQTISEPPHLPSLGGGGGGSGLLGRKNWMAK